MIDGGTPVQTVPGVNISLPAVAAIEHYHADAMYQFITKDSPCQQLVVDWCVYRAANEDDSTAYPHCLKYMKDYDIVNISLAGEGLSPSEVRYMITTDRPMIVVAAGNGGKAKHLSWPARFSHIKSNILAISAVDSLGIRLPSSNWDNNSIDFLGKECYKDRDGVVNCIQGTSIAAALYTNKLINELCPTKQRIGDKIK